MAAIVNILSFDFLNHQGTKNTKMHKVNAATP
jgi:hypothetical protein